MSSGIFPTWLKFSQVVPIIKKSDKDKLTNYRPISLLTSFSKIFEKVIYKRLDNHMLFNNILAKEQYGFRNNTSTEKAMYQLTNNILKALDNKYLVGGIFCNLTEALDCVDHGILLDKLEYYSIKGSANNLMKSYLKDRHQRVVIRNKYSSTHYSRWNKITREVPQGSVLGPLLFLTYINDLPATINHISAPTLFADDTNIICIHQDLKLCNKTIEETFLKINKWFQSNSPILNHNKTKLIQFSTKINLENSTCIDDEHNNMGNTQSTSFLGLILDKTLSWQLHIETICAKLKSACYILRSLNPFLSVSNLKTIYFSYIHSNITYSIIFWGNSINSDEVFKLQKRAIRIITNACSRTSCCNLFKELNILPLQSQYILSLAVYVAKNKEDFISNLDVHSINTRHKSSLHPPLLRLTKSQRGVYYAGIKIYNCLPLKIKELSGKIKLFKKSLKKFLLHGSFYTMEEYLDWTSLTDLNNLYYN